MKNVLILMLLTSLAGFLGIVACATDEGAALVFEESADGIGGDSDSAIGSVETATKEESAEVTSRSTESEDEPAEPSAEGARAGLKSDDTAPLFMDEETGGSGIAADTSEAASPAGTSRRNSTSAEASGLKAGFADDNAQFGYFVNFLEEYGDVPHFDLPIQERIILVVLDAAGKSVPNAEIEIRSGQQFLVSGRTMADGSYQFNPSEFGPAASQYQGIVRVQNVEREISFSRLGERRIEVDLEVQREIPQSVPVDILFIFDTTGSMGEEIQRLKTTIELIHLNLASLSFQPDIRFGMVLYKDKWDEYRTEVIPLTGDLDTFQEELSKVSASGGGDTPEDLQAALEQAMNSVEWNKNGIRLAFAITDAPPHLDYEQEFTYVDASRSARERAVKIFTVGTSGLDITGEYILRQISQYTSGKYIFLTYGETGESEGGRPGSVSHHTGANFQTDKLEAIIIRFTKEEISHLTDQPLEIEEPYFEAVKIADEKREDTLHTLFIMAIDQLLDFATIRIDNDTAAAILPIESTAESVKLDAEYFGERLIMAGAESSRFTLVERKDMQKLIDELKLQLSGVTDSDSVSKIGEFLNAELLIAGTLYEKEGYELFLKMLRVESGEVLSVTRAKIDAELGL